MSSDDHNIDVNHQIDPSADATIRNAFNDLNRRAMMVPTDNGPHQARTPNFNRQPGRRPLVPALAFAAVAAVAAGSVGVWQLQDDDPSVNVAAEAEDAEGTDDGVAAEPADSTDSTGQQADNSTDDGTTGDDGTAEPSEDTDDDQESTTDADDSADTGVTTAAAGDRFRVNTDRVAADTADPFLNVRLDPGVDGSLLAKLPPNYRGLEATGQTETVNGQTWIEVALMNPVAFDAPVNSPFTNPTGWLSGALVVPLADGVSIGTDEVPACSGDIALTPASGSGEFHVAGLESTMLSGDCLRVVVTMAKGASPFDWSAGSGQLGLPDVAVVDSPLGTRLDFSSTGTAWPGASDTTDGAFIMRDGDDYLADPECPRTCLDLVVLREADEISTTMLPELGAVVVDLKLAAGGSYNADAQVHLLQEPQTEPGAVIVEGIARPFEATLGIQIVDAAGAPVSARYSGGALGGIEGDQYGVNTTDWTEAWGYFIFRAEGLAPGEYTLVLDGDGGSDNPRLVEVPFTITG